MELETRGETEEIASYVYERALKVIRGAGEMYDVDVEIVKCGEAPSAESSVELADVIVKAANEVPEATDVRRSCMMAGSDDACWMMNRVAARGGKAAYMIVGSDTAAGHHNDHFDFDESVHVYRAGCAERCHYEAFGNAGTALLIAVTLKLNINMGY